MTVTLGVLSVTVLVAVVVNKSDDRALFAAQEDGVDGVQREPLNDLAERDFEVLTLLGLGRGEDEYDDPVQNRIDELVPGRRVDPFRVVAHDARYTPTELIDEFGVGRHRIGTTAELAHEVNERLTPQVRGVPGVRAGGKYLANLVSHLGASHVPPPVPIVVGEVRRVTEWRVRLGGRGCWLAHNPLEPGRRGNRQSNGGFFPKL